MERDVFTTEGKRRGGYAFLFLLSSVIPLAAQIQLSRPLAYMGMCDASAAVALNERLFAVANDEDNQVRIYRRDQGGRPVQVIDFTRFFEVTGKRPETDIEGVARSGETIYWITSHGRNKDGKVRPNRHRFLGTRFEIKGDKVKAERVGRPYTELLRDLIADPELRHLKLEAAAKLAPKAPGGLNIEGLGATAGEALLLGFRNPIPNGMALIIPLQNPGEMVRGKRAQFGKALQLDLGGLGIRDLVYWEGKYLIIAGPYNGNTVSKLYEWDGVGTPRALSEFELAGLNPEAAIYYPDKSFREVHLLSDDGTRKIGRGECKSLPEAEQYFRAVWATIQE
jgi:hypothetical protein